MIKRLQNKLSESKFTLPITILYIIGVWLLSGLILNHWWVPFACFALTTYVMVELNNSNALIRIYSRMVSCAFLALSGAACFLFSSTSGAIVQLCVATSLLLLFHSYQNKEAMGLSYYAFLCIGIASLAFVHIVFYLPIVWIMQLLVIQSLSWRTYIAGILGLLTPYWLVCCWLIYQQDFGFLSAHFQSLACFSMPLDFSQWTLGQIMMVVLLIIVSAIGITHYLRTSFHDRIRVRQLYNFFIWSVVLTFGIMCLQPHLYDTLVRMLIVFVSPLIAHYIALTNTRITNATFQALIAFTLLLTAYNLWTSSPLF